MDKIDIYHFSMGVVGSSLSIVGARFLQAEALTLTSALMVIGGVLVILASIVSHRTADQTAFDPGRLTWVAATCAGVCAAGLVVVMVLPISHPPA